MMSSPSPAPTRPSLIPSIPASAVPAVTAEQMAEVDRLATDVYGITLLQMMEQAGSHLAGVVAQEVGGDLRDRSIVVAVGPGNNGGGGLAAARHLVNRGARVRVVLARPARRLSEAGRHHLATLLEMGVSCCMAVYDITDDEIDKELADADLVIDAVLGYRGRGAPHDEVKTLLDHIATAEGRILSLDLPSGMAADTGEAAPGAVCSRATMTLALPKTGMLTEAGRAQVGDLYLADIGLPAALYARIGLSVDAPFSTARIVRLEA
ncbi:MAG: NAD(P)H-hydrate epimerase [Planctomycetota bacterium]|nr:MAG: NAD(P)H-hydrate epimerase [Planctomycetota bacterium]